MTEPSTTAASRARPFTAHRIEHGEGRVYARDYAGEGPAFVMMHGFPDNLGIYEFLVPYLVDAGRRVVTFDFLGFGASDRLPKMNYSFAQQQGDLEHVVDGLGLEKFVPVAHDSSGDAAVNYAIDHPERVASMVILNSVYNEVQGVQVPELIELFATKNLRKLTMAFAQKPEIMGFILNFQRALFQDALTENHVQTYVEFLGPLIDQNFRSEPGAGPAFIQMTAQFFDAVERNTTRIGQVEALDMPVKIIWGEKDPYLSIAAANDYKSRFKNATLDLVDAGHWLQIDEAKQVSAIMLS